MKSESDRQTTSADPGRPGRAKAVETKDSQHRQKNGQRFSRSHGSGNATSSEDNASQESQFHTVRLAVRHAVAAESVKRPDRDTGGDGGDRS
jgi:hypothetical protein